MKMVVDNPVDILYHVPTRTGQKDNYSLGIGFSATWSKPLDKELQDQCKEAAATQIALQQQLTANKRLDFEIARPRIVVNYCCVEFNSILRVLITLCVQMW